AMNWNDKEVETGVFNDILETAGTDAKGLAKYRGSYYEGCAALIETKVGDGKILHFGGTFTRNNVRDFLEYTGVLEPFAGVIHAPEECEIALREKDNMKYLFVLNFSKKDQSIELCSEMTDLDSGKIAKGAVTLAAYETKVYRLKSK
ncbi:MAG: Beta-galactosidase C-terminal domain, partial [Lachnospiraceae bacterium]|nr:Beta-galactosidase C-terminal domain [Lachnospiraceae bacterium]